MDAAVTRRNFIKEAGLAGLAVAGMGIVGCSADKSDASADGGPWDQEADVVVVGYGFAGATAAISAAQEGASVIVVEKAPQGGGNSACSCGYFHTTLKFADDEAKEQWITTRSELAVGTVDEETIRAFVEHEAEMPAWLEGDLGMEVNWVQDPRNNTFMGLIKQGEGTGAGESLWNFLAGKVDELGVSVLCNAPAKELVQDPQTREIQGVVVSADGADTRIKARKAVIMACGGYENNPAMQSQYSMPGFEVLPWGTPYNTGDGIAMTAAVGADMWHFGCIEYAGFCPKVPHEELDEHDVLVLGTKSGTSFYRGSSEATSFMFVNGAGERFMNENMGIGHQKTTMALSLYDGEKKGYRNYPLYLVCDDAALAGGALCPPAMSNGNPFTWNAIHGSYEWSADNQAEVERGWLAKADTVEELAGIIGTDPVVLKATMAEFNDGAAAGSDAFGREAEDMAPLAEDGPFYAMELRLCIINTMGGPRRDAECRSYGADGEPIARLYNVGEFGSLNGATEYLLGNISEALTSGRVAALDAVALEAWDGSGE